MKSFNDLIVWQKSYQNLMKEVGGIPYRRLNPIRSTLSAIR